VSVPEDVIPALQAQAVGAASTTLAPGTYVGAGRITVEPPPETPLPLPEPRSPELELALGRLVDYVDAYERQYSMLVAEEDYRQSMPQQGVRLRSDLLLVKPEKSPEWVSFRDVYEVDGVAVRDREDRLKELFLNPTAQSRAQLQAIKDESARYNIGPLERNINVPLFPLKFLIPANRDRFRYKLAGTPEAAGVRTWRIEYAETARPTLIVDRANNDVPASGWFLVEQLTGAIVESAVTVARDDYTAAIVVRYRRDASLGMWVPDEMKESFKAARLTGWPMRSVVFESILDGTARYSKFRRFQVKTEETVVVPK